ncbi:MAG TPA: hypothetical protein VHO07_03220 [Streptosporangiaceae bacterium]|jgi:hypothetical protein|nr:hypothetical protein [Streptosporangiaceae bacterium]
MIAAGALTAVTFALAAGSPADAAPAPESGGGGARAAVTADALPAAFPGCSWPLETTPSKVNVAAPDPYATYWTTPFIARPGYSLTIKGSFPTSRFMSFTVYNDSFQDFTNTVDASSVPSDLSDYQIAPDQGSENPWRTGQLGQAMNFTVRVIPGATAAQQTSENAIPLIDQNPPANPTGPPGVGYVIFRTYIPSGGNTAVQLPAVTVTHNGHSTTLPPCPSSAAKRFPALATVLSALKEKMSSSGTPASCTSGCAPDLQYFGPSAASAAGLFPNPVNGYIAMSFTPRRGYVVVTHGEAPSSPVDAGSGTPGDSIGAVPVSWVSPVFQVRYWSISNYLAESPYPVVEVGRGAKAIFGGTPDFLTTLDDGYYTVVSSLPSDKPSPSSLTANAATWIPTSASHPGTPELQILRNMLSQQTLYPEGFTFISPPASPSDIIPPATVQEQMGAYYPQTAQCTVQTFETGGWTGCLAASTG